MPRNKHGSGRDGRMLSVPHYRNALTTSAIVKSHRKVPLSPAFSVRVRDDNHKNKCIFVRRSKRLQSPKDLHRPE